MPKLVYTTAKGLVQETGTGVQFDEMPFSTVQPITTTLSSITAPGVYTVTASAGALTTYLPAPSTIPGGVITVRSLSPSAHALTGSSAVAGVNIFRGPPAVGSTVVGQKFTFAATVGETVTLISNGLAYCVAAGSGSISIP